MLGAAAWSPPVVVLGVSLWVDLSPPAVVLPAASNEVVRRPVQRNDGGRLHPTSRRAIAMTSCPYQNVLDPDFFTNGMPHEALAELRRAGPILRFEEVPELEVMLINRPEQPPVGAGEVSQGPTSAAIANAVADATGARLRNPPMTPERIASELRAQARPSGYSMGSNV